jgi:uncharacterized protein (TIGR00369 family)
MTSSLVTQADIIKKITEILEQIPFNRMLGLQMGEITPDGISINFSMKNELIGNYLYGILHGGVISSVLDMAGGVVVMLAAAKKREGKSFEELATILGKAGTINLHVDYIRPGKGEHFTAKAKIIHSGNKISFARMELYNHEATLIANGTGTYQVG